LYDVRAFELECRRVVDEEQEFEKSFLFEY